MNLLKPLVLNGPSGSGKSTLLNLVMNDFPNKFAFSVSHTTRSPRVGETDGLDYFFISKEEFLEGIDRGMFVEYAKVHGNFYGTSIQAIRNVQEAGLIPILDLNIDGAKSIVAADLEPILIFITVPNPLETIQKRLEKRGTESEESLQTRLQTARNEMNWFEQNKSFYHHIIVNDVLSTAVEELKNAIGLI